MKLTIKCEHGQVEMHCHRRYSGTSSWLVQCRGATQHFVEPDYILESLAEAGVLEVELGGWTAEDIKGLLVDGVDLPVGSLTRYVSPWKEAK